MAYAYGLPPDHWLAKIEALAHGDACEVQSSRDAQWYPAVVVRNTYLPGPWLIRWTAGPHEGGEGEVYIEQVRCPGQTEAWPR